jgi:hypothetical protein
MGSAFDRCSFDRSRGRQAGGVLATCQTKVLRFLLHAVGGVVPTKVDRDHFFSEIKLQE